jgi:hypothetical protein
MKKYLYHYSCHFEKCVNVQRFVSSFSGSYTANIKIDNAEMYEVFKTNIWNDVNKDIFQCFTKNDMQVISLTFLHEVEEG